jgi:release factor glutamine methyltransferase
MNIQNTLIKATKILSKLDIKNPILDSEILLSKAINKDRKHIILNSYEIINKKNLDNFNDLIERRKKGEPIAYITNNKDFWNSSFYVDRNVLVPRPDTELIIDQVLRIFPKNKQLQLLDIGVGSGCILLSLLKERPNFYGTGIDISKKSINISKYNAKILQLANRVKFFNSDVDNFKIGKYDIIVSNPPYIKLLNLKYLERDIINFEPRLALSGGLDGFSKIRKVISKATDLIKKNGKLILEIGFSQRNKVKEILKENGFYTNKVLKDYGKTDRCIVSTKI